MIHYGQTIFSISCQTKKLMGMIMYYFILFLKFFSNFYKRFKLITICSFIVLFLCPSYSQNDNTIRICSKIKTSLILLQLNVSSSVLITNKMSEINETFDSVTSKIQNFPSTLSSEYNSSLTLILSSLDTLLQEKDTIVILNRLELIKKNLRLKNISDKTWAIGEIINQDINVTIRILRNEIDVNGLTVRFAPTLFPLELRTFLRETSPTNHTLQPGLYLFVILNNGTIIKTKEDIEIGLSGSREENLILYIE